MGEVPVTGISQLPMEQNALGGERLLVKTSVMTAFDEQQCAVVELKG